MNGSDNLQLEYRSDTSEMGTVDQGSTKKKKMECTCISSKDVKTSKVLESCKEKAFSKSSEILCLCITKKVCNIKFFNQYVLEIIRFSISIRAIISYLRNDGAMTRRLCVIGKQPFDL